MDIFEENSTLRFWNGTPFEFLQHKIMQNTIGRKGLSIIGKCNGYVVVPMTDGVNHLVIDLNELL